MGEAESLDVESGFARGTEKLQPTVQKNEESNHDAILKKGQKLEGEKKNLLSCSFNLSIGISLNGPLTSRVLVSFPAQLIWR